MNLSLIKSTPLVDSFFSHCESLKGKFISVTYRKTLKLKKGFRDDVLETVSTFVVRCGIDYNNQQTVVEGHENGTIDPKKYRSPIKRVDGSNVRYYNEKTEEHYLGVTPSRVEGQKKKTYILNGSEVSYEEVEHMLYSSDKRGSKKDTPNWLYLKVNQITEFPSLSQ